MSRTPSSSLEIFKPKLLVGNLLHKRMTTDLDNGRNRPFSGPPFEKVKKFSKCGSEKGWLSKKRLWSGISAGDQEVVTFVNVR